MAWLLSHTPFRAVRFAATTLKSEYCVYGAGIVPPGLGRSASVPAPLFGLTASPFPNALGGFAGGSG